MTPLLVIVIFAIGFVAGSAPTATKKGFTFIVILVIIAIIGPAIIGYGIGYILSRFL